MTNFNAISRSTKRALGRTSGIQTQSQITHERGHTSCWRVRIFEKFIYKWTKRIKPNYTYCILVHVKNRQIWIKHLRQQWVWRGILFLLLVHLFFVFLESRFPRKSLATLRAVKRSSFLVCGRMTPHIRPVRERSIAHRALVRLFTSVNPQVALQQPRPAELFAAKFALAWQFVSSDVLFEEWKWVENQRAVFARVFLIGIRRGRDC